MESLWKLFNVCFLCCFVLSTAVFGQVKKTAPDMLPIKIDEASVMSSMLLVVDKKFDTLSTRITSLEQAVNNLQFYSLRQFKIINTNLQSVNSFIHGVHGQMTQLDSDSRAVKIALDILDQDMTDYTESNKEYLEDLSKTMTQIDSSLHDKTNDIKQSLSIMEENIVNKIISKLIPNVTTTQQPITTPTPTDIPCQVNITHLENHIDRRFVELKLYTQLQIASNINNISSIFSIAEAKQELYKHTLDNRKNPTVNKLDSLPEENFIRDGERKLECSLIENEKLFNALSNMTANIVQAVSYFRHTGSLFEAIITNTDSIAVDQTQIRQELTELKAGLQGQNFTDSGLFNDNEHKPSIKVNHTNNEMCSLSFKEMQDAIVKSRNETKFLDVVARLVLNTSVSLSNTLVGLQDEVFRLNEIGIKLSEANVNKVTYDPTRILQDILNHTKLTHNIARIIASNTGWMPHTFHRVGAVGEQLNKSLEITQNLYGDFSNVFDIQMGSKRGKEHNKAQTVMESALNHRAQTASREYDILREDNVTSLPSSPLLNLIFDTNKELKRIMPALTRLIAEPEPLFTLINGQAENEGRLEVYHKGQWGTLCGHNLDNAEASIICRSLGYFGGVAAEKGSFGPGKGGFWGYNKTCIRNQRCPVVNERIEFAHCKHANDLGIVCDHMMRLIDMDGFISRSRGRLQLYHKGRWRPICSRGWKESEVRTTCRQLGYRDGRLINGGEVKRGNDNLFVSNVICEKEANILHSCNSRSWTMSKCNGYLPVALYCQ
ncbi:uncharacterized protein LOC126832172 [Patella vulgata]|uniref:uncharacterized protein LOC126832172 n=1 Tax=Patella vulgata TaxID=6465 RepID=UPI0021805CFF|nr:uncharacterized protein LOC126832172 [Patella vulgata]